MIFRKNELELLFPFYLFYLIISLSGMVFPFMIIYFRELQFSFFQIGAMLAAYSISMVIFEIPTGAIADGWSRKYSTIFGFILAGIAVIGIGFSSTFWPTFGLFVVLGLAMTMVSGAEEAWVIDNLNHHKRKDLHKEFFIKMPSILAFGGVFASLAGAFIVHSYSIQPLWFVWGTTLFLGAVLLAVMSEENYKPKRTSLLRLIKESISNIKEGTTYAYNHKTVFYLILASIFLTAMAVDADYWQPFLTDLNMPVFALGIVFSLVSLASMIFPFLARYLEKYNIATVFTTLIVIRILVFAGVLFLYPPLFILGAGMLIFGEGLLSLRYPLLEPHFQQYIPKRYRATITSIKSMGNQIGLGIAAIFFGFIADHIGVQNTIPLTGLVGIIAIICLYQLRKSNEKPIVE